jgi:universal stress protein E
VTLAKANSAQLLFFYVLPKLATQLDAQSQVLLEMHHGRRTVKDDADQRIVEIAQIAQAKGVKAEGRIGLGTSWIELIRQVQSGEHDLLIAGSRHHGRIQSALLGSTSIKLLRKCPCPVWIMQPGTKIDNILVAHDLTPVGDEALDLGVSMARLNEAQLHILHALDHSDVGPIPGKDGPTFRQQAEEKITSQLAQLELRPSGQIHVENHAPSIAILDFVDKYSIDLLVMGTVARTGIAGLIMGNTAEKLLPRISCSILALKPEGFRTPVALE